MNWKKNLLSFLLGLSGVFMKAQTPVSFTSDQGLSNTCIRSIMEDSRKNVWISTQSGLNRYDGVKMNVYRHKKGEAGTLGHDMVSCALEVEPGSVLAGMESGVQMYSYDTDRFTDVPIIVVGGDTIHAHVISMTKLSGDSIYVCTAGYGLYRLCEDEDGKKFLKEMRDFPPFEQCIPPSASTNQTLFSRSSNICKRVTLAGGKSLISFRNFFPSSSSHRR